VTRDIAGASKASTSVRGASHACPMTW
jgi:hypothetical protein